MKGPFDAATEEQRAAPNGRLPEPPAGGKALTRLLQLLESAGLTEAVEEAVDAAVADEARAAFLERGESFRALPPAPQAGSRRRGGRAADAGGVATSDVAREYLSVGEHLGPPTGVGPRWESLGPWTVPGGQTYGNNRVNVSGRVSCVAVDPANPAHVLVGAANGGVWESQDRGTSWAPRSDYLPTTAIGAVTFDPSRPAIVYAGTGEGDWWSFLGAGVMRSTDGGTNWAMLATDPFVGQGFYDLAVDPADGSRLVAGTTGGLFTSDDGGVTWTRRRSQPTYTVSIAPGGGAAAEVLAASRDGLFRSTDRQTWTAVALPGAPGTFSRLAARIAPSDGSVAYTWGATGSTGFLWRRSGGTWTAIAAPPGVNVGQAWYDWFLGVSPDNAGQIYCGAIEVHRGTLGAGSWVWVNITDKDSAGMSIHPDQHAIAFEPGSPDTIYIGNDGGLYRSPDRGVAWNHCNNGLIITEFEYLAHDPGSSRWILGGTQDNGTERWSLKGWEHVADGDGGDCAVSREDPRTVFHTYYGMSPERSGSGGDFGSWTWIAPPVPQGEGSLFYPPFESSASNGQTIALGGDALYVSRNNGAAWTRLPLPTAGRSSAMSIPNADTVYVGTTGGLLYRTTWNGAAWTALAALTTPRAGAYVSDLYVAPADLQRIWVTHRTVNGGRVFLSTDGGSTWADRTAGLPNLPINAVEVDPANANRLWVAADRGVYQSSDGGASWTDFANGLPNSYVGDLVFHPHARVLRAATRNRGLWQIPVDGWMSQPRCGVQWTGQLQGNQTLRWFTHSWPATWHVLWTVMPVTPRPGGPQITWKVELERPHPEYATYFVTVTNHTPEPVTFEGRFCILSRY